MASSRLDRVGTIYSRITGLLRSGAMKPENKPIWYDVYQHFPPKFAPRVDRPVPNVAITPIFYPEDVLRSKLAKENFSVINAVNLEDSKRLSNSQKCIAYFEEFKEECENEEEAWLKAVERVVAEIPVRKSKADESTSISEEFQRAKENLKIADLFKKD